MWMSQHEVFPNTLEILTISIFQALDSFEFTSSSDSGP